MRHLIFTVIVLSLIGFTQLLALEALAAPAPTTFTQCVRASNNPEAILAEPAGKQAVIEYVGATFQIPSTETNTPPSVILGTISGFAFRFSTVAQGTSGFGDNTFVANHLTRIYVPPAATVAASATVAPNPAGPGGICVSGRFEAP